MRRLASRQAALDPLRGELYPTFMRDALARAACALLAVAGCAMGCGSDDNGLLSPSPAESGNAGTAGTGVADGSAGEGGGNVGQANGGSAGSLGGSAGATMGGSGAGASASGAGGAGGSVSGGAGTGGSTGGAGGSNAGTGGVSSGGGAGMNGACTTKTDCAPGLICVANASSCGVGTCLPASACGPTSCGYAACQSSGGTNCMCFTCAASMICTDSAGCFHCLSHS